jgi:hypothetical protein
LDSWEEHGDEWEEAKGKIRVGSHSDIEVVASKLG